MLITTLPVPPGVKFISALELDPMVLSLNVKLSIVVVPTKLVVLVTFNVESVVKPEGTARVEPRLVAPVSVEMPETFKVPSTISPSFMLMIEESSELNDVPAILIAPKITEPVPLGIKLMLSLVLVPSMLLSLIFMAGNDTDPVPAGTKTISSLVLVALISLPENERLPENNGEA